MAELTPVFAYFRRETKYIAFYWVFQVSICWAGTLIEKVSFFYETMLEVNILEPTDALFFSEN